MRTALSARMGFILGASLAAMIFPTLASAERSHSTIAGIDSGSALGIDSGSTQGIDSGSALGIDSGSIFGIDSGSALGIDSGSALVLAGPIESVDLAGGYFVSIGQRVLAPLSVLESLLVGDFVSVSGTIAGAGWLYADEVSVSDLMYVPGATEVVVTGIPSAINTTLGTATIGGLTVDYTGSLGNSSFNGIGDAITVIGIQPASGGAMLSDRVIDQGKLIQ